MGSTLITFTAEGGEVNWSGGGVGVANNFISSDQILFASFNQTVSKFEVDDFDTNGKDHKLTWVAYLDGNEVGQDTIQDFGSGLVIEIDGGFDKLEFIHEEGGGIRIDSFSTIFGSESLDYSMMVNYIAFDGDSDSIDGDFDVTFSPNNVFTGSESNDVIMGTDGDDTLIGGDGDDILIGGAGDDILYGGEGADTFVWDFSEEASHQGTQAQPAFDKVMDYSIGDGDGDVLEFRSLLQGDDGTDDIGKYLHLESDGDGNSILYISTEGAFADAVDTSSADQQIFLKGFEGELEELNLNID